MTSRQWCDECRSMQEVEDEFEDDTGDSRVTVVVSWVVHLACGHSAEHVTGTYRSPLQQSNMPRSYSMPDPFGDES